MSASTLRLFVGDLQSAPARPRPILRLTVVEPLPIPVRPPSLTVVRAHAAAPQTLTLEAQIIAAFDRPAELGQTAADAFRDKEHNLRQLFAALSVAEARALQQRLTISENGDPIASRFAVLVVERRARLIAVLQDARRRAAIAASRA